MAPLAGLLVVLALAYLLANYARLKQLPGPPLAPWSPLWYAHLHQTPAYGRHLVAYHRQYGPVVRLGPQRVSVAHPASVVRCDGRPLFDDDHPASCLATARRAAEEARAYEGVIDGSAEALLQSIRHQHVIDLPASFRAFATQYLHHLLDDPSRRLQEHLSDRGPWKTLTSWVSFTTIENLVLRSPGSRLKRTRRGYRGPAIPPARTPSQPRTSTESLDELRAITASADAISSAFVSSFYFLLRDRRALSRVRAEIDALAAARLLSDPPRWSELRALRFLDSVMRESARLSAPGSQCETEAPEGGVVVGARYVPARTAIVAHSAPQRCDTEVYGLDADAFRPERWMTPDRELRRRMDRGLSPLDESLRTCAPMRAAWMELKKVLAWILLRNDMRLLSVEEAHDASASPPLSMTVRFAPRTNHIYGTQHY